MTLTKAHFFLLITLALLIALVSPALAEKPADELKRVETITQSTSAPAPAKVKPAAKPGPSAATEQVNPDAPKPVQIPESDQTQPSEPVSTPPATVQSSAKGSSPALTRVTDVEVTRMGNSLRVLIYMDGNADAVAKRIKNPPRLLVDVKPAKLAGRFGELRVGEVGVSKVRAGQNSDNTARVVLDLFQDIKHRLVVNPNSVVLWVDSKNPPVKSPAPKPVSTPAAIENKPQPDQPALAENPTVEKPSIPTNTAPAVNPVQINAVNVEALPNGVRVRISVDRSVKVSALMLQNPIRLAVDIPNSVLANGEQSSDVSLPPVTAVRTGQMGDKSRVVLDLTGRVGYNISNQANDILIDLSPIKPRDPRKLAGTRIVIDPGHGGHQPGARGWGLLEKNINLAVGKKVAALLREMGAIVTMTRSDDRYVSLDGRVVIAQNQGADLFVSIHCNSNGTPNSRSGTELYYYTSQSHDLAACLQKKLVAVLGSRNGGVFQRRFLVVRKATMPAALIEIGYINHSGDAAKLSNPEYQNKVARGTVAGIASFLGDTSITIPDIPAIEENIQETPEQTPSEDIEAPVQEESSSNETNE